MHMNQRGSITLIWVGAIAAVAAMALGAVLINNYGDGRYDEGKADEHAAWTKREASELATANGRIRELNTQAREQESQNAIALAVIGKDLEKKRDIHERRRDDAIDAARVDPIGLRVPIQPGTTTCQDPGGNPAGETATAPGERDGAATARLSDEAARFFVSEATRANQIVEQLTACQAHIGEYLQSQGRAKP